MRCAPGKGAGPKGTRSCSRARCDPRPTQRMGASAHSGCDAEAVHEVALERHEQRFRQDEYGKSNLDRRFAPVKSTVDGGASRRSPCATGRADSPDLPSLSAGERGVAGPRGLPCAVDTIASTFVIPQLTTAADLNPYLAMRCAPRSPSARSVTSRSATRAVPDRPRHGETRPDRAPDGGLRRSHFVFGTLRPVIGTSAPQPWLF